MLFNITQRKIGPGLKANLKFLLFSQKTRLVIGFQPLSVISTHMAKLPFDAELYLIIMEHLRGYSSTRSMLINTWLNPNIEKCQPADAALLIASNTSYGTINSAALMTKTKCLIGSSIIDKRLDDRRIAEFAAKYTRYNIYQRYNTATEVFDFVIRNVKDQEIQEAALTSMIGGTALQRIGNWNDGYTEGLADLTVFLARKRQEGLISSKVLNRLVDTYHGSMDTITEGDRIILAPRTKEAYELRLKALQNA